MRVRLVVNLSKPTTGQAIADAVRRIAGKEFVQSRSLVTDEGTSYLLGLCSHYPYKDVAIGVGPDASPDVRMEGAYDTVYVLSWKFGGDKFLVTFGNDEIVEAVREFRDTLQDLL